MVEILRIHASDSATYQDAESLLLRTLPQLARVAERLTRGNPRIDPQDLLAEAVAHLYAQWSKGGGPDENVAGYISTSMRNALKDEWKSARSSEISLPVDWSPSASDEPFADAELHRENRLLMEALDRLPADQRTVLVRGVLLDEKPRHLATHVRRSAPAVSSLLRRSRISLRRALVTVFLLDRAQSQACTEFAVSDTAAGYADSLLSELPAAGHHRSCESCAGALVEVRDYARATITTDMR